MQDIKSSIIQCDGKNFSRRKACQKCSKSKTINAKIVPVVKQKQIQQPTAFNAPLPAASQMPLYHQYGQANSQNNIIQSVNPLAQNVSPQLLAANIEMPNTSQTNGQRINNKRLTDFFQQYAQVKDVRLIKEKHKDATTQAPFKDFAFVEFFSIDDASQTLEQAKYNKLKIRGSSVYVSFSKFKRHEKYFESFFDQSQGIKNQQNETQPQKQFPVGSQSQDLVKLLNQNITLPRKQFIEPDPINLQNNQHREELQQTFQDREKDANELKRWEKEQQKIEKFNKQLMRIDKSLLIMPDNLTEYENVPKLIENKSQEIEEQNKVIQEQAAKVPAPTQYEVHIFHPCKRLFRTLNTILKHQQDSLFTHQSIFFFVEKPILQVSYEMSQKRARDENRQRVQESLRKESLVDQYTANTSSQEKLHLHEQNDEVKLSANKRRDRDEHNHRDYNKYRNERDHHDKVRRESFSHKDLRSDSHLLPGSDSRHKHHKESFDNQSRELTKKRRSSRSSLNKRNTSEGRSSSPYEKKRRRY